MINSLHIWLTLLSPINNPLDVATGTGTGLVVFLIIEVPMLILILASILSRPRMRKVTGIFIGVLATLVILFIVFTYLMSIILSFIVP